MTTGLIQNNPVVSLGMALPFVIVPSTSLKSAVMMSVFIFAATVPCGVIAPIIKEKVEKIYALPIYCIISMLFVTAAKIYLRGHAVLLDQLGIYIPLAALNSMMIEVSAINPKKTWFKGLCRSVMMCMGFALVCCGMGALREIFSNHTIWDIPFKIYSIKIVGVSMPFFGFILIGFFSALCRSIDRGVTRTMLAVAPLALPAGDENSSESVGEKV